MSAPPPIVLTFAGSDPTGGAGLQADLLTLASMGCHPFSVVTALTVQDTHGVASLDAIGNVVPYIGGGEEEKIETESLKILGTFDGGEIRNAPLTLSATTTRVPVPDGHTAVMSIELTTRPSIEEVTAALRAFTAEPQERRLPTAPANPIVVHTAQDRPQPRLDVHEGGGMPVHVGRERPCPVLGYKLIAMGHNVVRGAAGAALLNAELLVARGTGLTSAIAETDSVRRSVATSLRP